MNDHQNRHGTMALLLTGGLFLVAASSGITARQAKTAAPSTITGTATSNSEGTSDALARADHTHACVYTATGTGAIGRACASKLGDVVSVCDFIGNTCPSGVDDTTAIQAARDAVAASGATLYFPAGTYKYTASPNWAINNLHIRGGPGTVLSFTGTGNAFVADAGAVSGSVSGIVVESIVIKGSATATNGVFLRGVHRSQFKNIKVRNVSAACLLTNFAVVNTFDNFRCSSNEDGGFTTTPVNGIKLDQRGVGEQTTASVFTDPVIEGVSGSGIVLVSANNITIQGGTSEGNNVGVEVQSTSKYALISNMDLEANTVNDALVSGTDCTIAGNLMLGGGSGPSLSLPAASTHNLVSGGWIHDITNAGTGNAIVSVDTFAGTLDWTLNKAVVLPNASAVKSIDEAGATRSLATTDGTGATHFYGYHGVEMLQGVSGATRLYDGSGNVAAVASSGVTATVMGGILNAQTIVLPNTAAYKSVDDGGAARNLALTDATGSTHFYGYHASEMVQGVSGATRIYDGGGNVVAVASSAPSSTTMAGVLTASAFSAKNSTGGGTITLNLGSGTATVFSGARCVCTDTTANASVKCAVAATTLTATGTGSDVIAYLCF